MKDVVNTLMAMVGGGTSQSTALAIHSGNRDMQDLSIAYARGMRTQLVTKMR
jgi:hypothetical protein